MKEGVFFLSNPAAMIMPDYKLKIESEKSLLIKMAGGCAASATATPSEASLNCGGAYRGKILVAAEKQRKNATI